MIAMKSGDEYNPLVFNALTSHAYVMLVEGAKNATLRDSKVQLAWIAVS